MLVIIRSNAILGDPRVEKYCRFLDSEEISYRVIGWNRTHEKVSGQKFIYYLRKTSYALGGFKAVKERLFWFFFCLKSLFSLNKVDVIHGCDLDGVFPAVLYKILGHWNVKIIFDVFDWYSATLFDQNKIVRLAFRMMEKISVSFSSKIIICESERIRQIPYQIKDKVEVLPNIPNFKDISFLQRQVPGYFENKNITLSYVGSLYEGRFLNELLDVAEKGLCNLLIAGYGDKSLEDRCQKLSSFPNVRYFGKVRYSEGLNIMYNSDVIFAMYCKTNPNHIYAAPNKFYEAMLLSKPIISTKGTIVGEKIEKLGFGFTIEESMQDLEHLILSLSKEDIISKGNNAHNLWITQYRNYVQVFMENKYKTMINY